MWSGPVAGRVCGWSGWGNGTLCDPRLDVQPQRGRLPCLIFASQDPNGRLLHLSWVNAVRACLFHKDLFFPKPWCLLSRALSALEWALRPAAVAVWVALENWPIMLWNRAAASAFVLPSMPMWPRTHEMRVSMCRECLRASDWVIERSISEEGGEPSVMFLAVRDVPGCVYGRAGI